MDDQNGHAPVIDRDVASQDGPIRVAGDNVNRSLKRTPQEQFETFQFSEYVMQLVDRLELKMRQVLPVLVMSVNPRRTLTDMPGAPTYATVQRWLNECEAFNAAYLAAWNDWNSFLMANGAHFAIALARRLSPECISTLAAIMRGDVTRYPGSTERIIVGVDARRLCALDILDYALMGTATTDADIRRARDIIRNMTPVEQTVLIATAMITRGGDGDNVVVERE